MQVKSLILKVHRNERIRWEEKFPSVYGEKTYNGNNKRNTCMALKELQYVPLSKIRKEADKLGLMYCISQNHHNDKWGLDKIQTPEGGGVTAQSDTYVECIKRAHKEYGIHPIFIYGVGVDGW